MGSNVSINGGDRTVLGRSVWQELHLKNGGIAVRVVLAWPRWRLSKVFAIHSIRPRLLVNRDGHAAGRIYFAPQDVCKT